MRAFHLASLLCLVAVAAVASACASAPSPDNTYAARLAKLETDCKASGGMLMSTGRLTNEPQTDNVCHIVNGATRVSQQ